MLLQTEVILSRKNAQKVLTQFLYDGDSAFIWVSGALPGYKTNSFTELNLIEMVIMQIAKFDTGGQQSKGRSYIATERQSQITAQNRTKINYKIGVMKIMRSGRQVLLQILL